MLESVRQFLCDSWACCYV